MKIILTGDWHLGAATVSESEIETIKKKYWKDKPVLLLGDICDFGLDRGMNFDNKYDPQTQVKLAKKMLKGLNVKAYVLGNHCDRICKKVGLNFMELILDTEPRNEITIDGCKFFITHGHSAADNDFAEFGKLLKYVDADIIAAGHSHALVKKTILRGGKRVTIVRCGSFLEDAAYAKFAAYAPLLKGWVEVDTKTKYVKLYAIEKGRVILI